MERGISSRDYNCLAEGCGRHFTNKDLPTVTSMQFNPLQGSVVPGSGLMAPAHVLIISRTGKHLGSTLAASMALVSNCPMDVRIHRLGSFDTGLLITRMGAGPLNCKTHCTFYFTWLIHLLDCVFNLKIILLPYYVMS